MGFAEMPRLRIRLRPRRPQPQLNSGVWEWLKNGRPPIADVDKETAWQILALECNAHSRSNLWDEIESAVRRGDLEVSDIQHTVYDAPLVRHEVAQ